MFANSASERSQALTVFVPPNFTYNFAELQSLTGPDQHAVVFSEYFLKFDMTLDQQGTISRGKTPLKPSSLVAIFECSNGFGMKRPLASTFLYAGAKRSQHVPLAIEIQ